MVEAGDVEWADGHVQAIVNDRLALGFCLPRPQCLEHRLVGRCLDKINNGRRSSKSGGACAIVKIVAGGEAADRHPQMDMDINRTGDNIFVLPIQFALAREVRGNGRDLFAIDGDIGGEYGFGRDHRAVFDNQIVGRITVLDHC